MFKEEELRQQQRRTNKREAGEAER
jgi:hypothetical protein